jgi:hypothetical protein
MSDLIERATEILSHWNRDYDHLRSNVADPTAHLYQDTFAGFIYDDWQESYSKKMQEPDIRQKVEDHIKMIKERWK